MNTTSALKTYEGLVSPEGVLSDLKLTHDQCCVILKIHDYGLYNLTGKEQRILYDIVSDLKTIIHP